MKTLEADMKQIEECSDLLERALLLSALVTRLFRQEGWNLVVVRGSAVEFYTEGNYMSGDVDLCRREYEPIPLRLAQEVMGKIGGVGGPRSWKVAGLFVDILGLLENEARISLQKMQTPLGEIEIIPKEMALVERTLISVYPQKNSEAREVAKKMMAICVKDENTDWEEVWRLGALPSFAILEDLKLLKKEVSDELEK